MSYYNLPSTKAFLVAQKAIIQDKDKILLLKNAVTEFDNNSEWELPGGLVELNESLPTALDREVFEETKLKIKTIKPFFTWDYWHKEFKYKDGRVLDTKIIFIAYITKKISGKIILSHEHQDCKWVAKNEILKLNIAPYVLQVLEKYQKEI